MSMGDNKRDALLSEIANTALEMRGLCSTAVEVDDPESYAYTAVAVRKLANYIGWLADRHIDGPGVNGGADDWFLPPSLLDDPEGA